MTRLSEVLARVEQLLPSLPVPIDWRQVYAARWQLLQGRGQLVPITHTAAVTLDDLLCIDAEKHAVVQNTVQFLAGLPANNVLLWGARGTGKSSLIKALLTDYAVQGLRVIEVDKAGLAAWPEIAAALHGSRGRFILFCDDLSFDAGDGSYKTVKAALDGCLTALPENLLVYASSNRRHLLPETMQDNLAARHVDGELHPGEAVEEKISLAERFGIWLGFHPFTQEDYLCVTAHWLGHFKLKLTARLRVEALAFALAHGSRSGRVAWQFAVMAAGRFRLARRGK